MGIAFAKLKNKIKTYQPIPIKQGRVRGNTNISKVGLKALPARLNCTTHLFTTVYEGASFPIATTISVQIFSVRISLDVRPF